MERWKMNRLGLVNFWVYDEQEYLLKDGKILLRGQNGSGKSITTQSFIPFILDGNRAPNRLDPFGSVDRKMEYYFLWDGEREDVTGYLYLEFKMEGREEYRTIGIGQRAKAGKKSMDFWGFIILDGRRVGRNLDIQLSQEVGNQYIPLTSKQLKNLLGEKNCFYESNTEYMNGVNKYLFGFPQIEQYEQFVQLLIKVRAPKLSKEFKPSKVYEILNDSLQVLTDDDLRVMVDAMEKLDEIELRLEGFKKTEREVNNILSEYGKYNRYNLVKKADRFINSRSYAEKAEKEYNDLISGIDELADDTKQRTEDNQKKNIELAGYKSRREAWLNSDIYKNVEMKDEIQKNLEETKRRYDDKKASIERIGDKRRELEKKLKEYLGNIELYESNLNGYMDEISVINDSLCFESHENVIQYIKQRDKYDADTTDKMILKYKNALDELNKSLRVAIDKIAVYTDAKKSYSEMEERTERIKETLQLEEDNLNQIIEKLSDIKDMIIEGFIVACVHNKELHIEEAALEQLKQLIIDYSGVESTYECQNICMNIYSEKKEALAEEKTKCVVELEDVIKDLERVENELDELYNMKDPIPDRSEQIDDTRVKLEALDITFASFYELIDFDGECSDSEMAMIEKQLMASGLLDAIVIADKDRIKAESILKDNANVIIRETARVDNPIINIKAADETDYPELKDKVQKILAGIAGEHDDNAEYVLGTDGYYRNGIIEGRTVLGQEDEAGYIGAARRRKLKEKMISDKEKEKNDLTVRSEDIDKRINTYDSRLSLLKEEYDNIPALSELMGEYLKMKDQEKQTDRVRRELEDILLILEEKKLKMDTAYSDMENICSKYPYDKKEQAYKDAIEDINDYKDGLQNINATITKHSNELLNMQVCQERIDDCEFNFNELMYEGNKLSKEIKSLEEKIKGIDDILNNPENEKQAQEMSIIADRIALLEREINENDNAIIKNESLIEERHANVENSRSQMLETMREKSIIGSYFNEELALELVYVEGLEKYPVISEDTSGNKLWSEDNLYEIACIVKKQYNDIIGKEESEMISSLMEAFQKNTSYLGSYGAEMVDMFPSSEVDGVLRRRKLINASWQGQKIPIKTFELYIGEAIEETSLLIKKKDRELFEKILSDTLSHKLTARIDESRHWIKEMSDIMSNMDTSMGLNFSLKWMPKSAESLSEMGTAELEKLLLRDKALLSDEDVDRVAEHFRTKIQVAKRNAIESGEIVNYLELVRSALDFRQWFEFRMYYTRSKEPTKELTNSAFNKLSGGEKAMAMYIPLFAAVNAQYMKSKKSDHPRLIALDEAFAGVDDVNIASMFELLETLDFDYIINSQSLWGCYETVKNLKIAELDRPQNADFVSVINYTWNGKQRIMEG